MAKKLISYDDTKPGLGLPDAVEGEMRRAFSPVDAPLAPKRRFMPGLDPHATKLIFAPHEGHGWRLVGAADGGTVTEDTSRPGPFSDRSIRISRVSSITEVWNPNIPAVNLDDGPLVVWVHMPFQASGGLSIMLGHSFNDRWHWDESSVQESSALSPHIDGWTAYELYPERAAKFGNPLRHSLKHLRVRANGTNYTYWLGGVGQRIAPVARPRLPERVVINPGKTAGITLGTDVDEVEIKSPNGTSSYQLTYTAGSEGVLAAGLAPTSLDDLLEQETVFWFKFPPGMTQPAGVSVDLYGDEISQSSRYQLYIYGDNRGDISYQYPGWVGVRLTSEMGLSPIGTPPTTITAARVTALSGNASPVLFGGVEVTTPPEPLYPHGVLTIFFDDGYLDTYTRASKVLGRYGFPGVLSAIASSVGNPGMVSVPQLREMQDRSGWEIAGHSFSPNGPEYRFTNLSPEDLEAEMRNLKTWLVSNGFDTETLVSPGGQFSREVWEVARRYFSLHRGVGATVRHGAHNQSPRIAYPARMTSPNFSATSVPVSRMKEIIDKTVEARSWGTITFHQVIDGPSSGQQISVADLDEICAYAAASGVAVRTPRQIMEEAN